MDKDLIEYGGKTENFDPRIVIFEGSPRPRRRVPNLSAMKHS